MPLPANAPHAFETKELPGSILDLEFLQSNIVVLDDEIAITSIISNELGNAGFQNVNSFNDSAKAIEFMATSGCDVVLLDLNIPVIDGMSVLRFLRAQKATQYVPVIILTSKTDDQTRIKALAAGANDYLVKPVNAKELTQRVKNALSFKHYADRIERQVRAVEQELRTDSLTGLNNRRSFDEYSEQCFESSVNQQVSLILFDVDEFKQVNDTYGHQAGDQVLQNIGNIVLRCCQQCDFPARIGGDEFAIVSTNEDPNWPQRLAERIRSEINAETINVAGSTVEVSCSFGVSLFTHNQKETNTLFADADKALYESKRKSRNAISFYRSQVTSEDAPESVQSGEPCLAESIRDPRSGRILVVDDEAVVTRMLQLHLKKSGFLNVETENDAQQAIPRIAETLPDLVILDIRMPKINGLEILRDLKANEKTASIPVLIMTASTDEKIRLASLKLQASDFLTKPPNAAELDARVYNSLKLKMQHDQLKTYSSRMKHEVEVRTAELFATRRETIFCLARAAESRDTDTGNHVIRVGQYAAIIARQLGMDEDYIGWIELAAQLHDVGKLSIPDSILRKPGKLTAEERKVIETHCHEAEKILCGKSAAEINSPLLKMAARIASTHHEKWDGTGYPYGLAGTDIPIEGRITAVADVFDALSMKRAYKDAIPPEKCYAMIIEDTGKHFDPAVVKAFVEAKSEIIAAKEKWDD